MKILAVGCSFTAGAELPDIRGQHFSAISKLAYPKLLGNLYNAEVTNLSLGGGSNGRTFRKVMFELCEQTYDLVICGWTSIERLDLSYQDQEIPGTLNDFTVEKVPWIKNYYAYNHDLNLMVQTYFAQIISLQTYFKYSRQKYLFISVQPIFDWVLEVYQPMIEKVDQDYFIGWPNYGMVDFMGDCPKGPGGHPLELGHQRIANTINEHIRNLGWFS